MTLSDTTTTTLKPDCWGNVGVQEVSTTGAAGVYKTSVTKAYNDDNHKRWGLPDTVAISKAAPGVATLTRTTSYVYDANTGLPKSETVEQGTAALEVKTEYDRSANAFGLVNKVTQTWKDPVSAAAASRSSNTTYDDNGRYPVRQSNAKGHEIRRDYFPGTGAAKSTIDPNQLSTIWQADGFGRPTRQTTPDGNETRTNLKACLGCTAGATSVQIVERYHGADRIAVPQLMYNDNLGRPISAASWNFNGRPTLSARRYDDLGHEYETDQPGFDTATPQLASRQLYDDLNRVTSVIVKDEGGSEQLLKYEYAGLTTTITNARGKKRIETRNEIGQLMTVRDALNHTTSFVYDAFGNLSRTTDPQSNVIDVSYDLLGRKTDLRDPDLGWIHYDVDPLGRTYRQISPKQRKAGGPNDQSRFEFDVLDRMTARYESDLESHWEFDVGTAGIGKLSEAYTGTLAQPDYRRKHSYDSVGRPSMTQQILFDATYIDVPAYDLWSRVIRNTYQRGSDAAKVFAVRYNAYGYQSRIERGNLALWEVQVQDAANRPIQVALGNGLSARYDYNQYRARLMGGSLVNGANATVLQDGYSYNPIGSVTNRTQSWAVVSGGVTQTSLFSENFDYDDLERIKFSQVVGQDAQNFEYEDSGNIKSKPSAGVYTYPQGANAVRPHAVSSTTLLGSFDYDDNGNLLNGGGRSATWSSFDMPLSLSKGSSNSSIFVYGPEHQRVRQVRSDGGSTVRTVYAGAQEVEINGTQVTVKTYWPNGVGVEIDRPGTGTSELNWTYRDRLGSVIGLSDESGKLREGTMFDTWGKRRTLDGKPVGGTSTPDALDGKTDNRGYTGHEMLDNLDLVHMNGRVYDPLLGRFLSADPLVQDPVNGQSYNRYSYALNNPTNLTDPTGFQSEAGDTSEGAQKPEACTGSRIAGGCGNMVRCVGTCTAEEKDAVTAAAAAAAREKRSPGPDAETRQKVNPAGTSANTTPSGNTPHTVWEDAKEALLINDIQRVYVTAKKLATDTVNYIGGDDKEKQAAGASFKQNWQEYVGLGMMLATRGRSSEGALAKGARAPNMTPAGAGRAGAFNAAKREAGIPTSQQPSRTMPNEDLRGNPQPGRIYEFEVPAPGGGTRTIRIRDDAGGHDYGPGDPQNRGPHFNDPAKNHYDYDH